MFTIENTALIVIDIQEKLFRVMHEKEELAANNVKLIKGLKALDIPVIVTEQNPKGLGPTIPEIVSLLPDMKPLEKFAFSCCMEDSFTETLTELTKQNRYQILITGIETHICVYQTAMDLKNTNVQIVKDCVSSRTPGNRDSAIRSL